MTTLDRIRADRDIARKAHDPVISNILGIVISDCENKAHGSPGKGSHELTEADILGVVQGWAKKTSETMALIKDRPERVGEYVKMGTEAAVLAAYLPTERLSAERLREIATEQKGLDIGKIMQYLKTEYPGQYDAREASVIIKDVLVETSKE